MAQYYPFKLQYIHVQLIDKGDNKIYCITEKMGREEEGDIASGEETKVQQKNLTDCTHSVCTTKKTTPMYQE